MYAKAEHINSRILSGLNEPGGVGGCVIAFSGSSSTDGEAKLSNIAWQPIASVLCCRNIMAA